MGFTIVSNSGGGHPSSNRKTTIAVATEFVEYAIRNEKDIYDWSENDANRFWEGTFGAYAFMDEKDGYGYPKPGFENTHKLQSLIIDRAQEVRIADFFTDVPPRPRDRFQRELRELIQRAIEEVEKAGGRSSAFDAWQRGSPVGNTGGSRNTVAQPERADVNSRDADGKTPLHTAAKNGTVEIVKDLISKGGDVNVRDDYGSTPLHGAARNGNVEVFKFLVSQGADVNAKDNDSVVVFHLTINVEAAEFLLRGCLEITDL